MLCVGSGLTGTRPATGGVVFSLAVLLLGCGSLTTDSSPAEGSEAGRSEDFELDVGRCAGFGPAEAAATLGVPAEAFEDSSQDLSGDSRRCILTNTKDSKMGVIFTVSRADSVKKAAVDFAQFRNNVAVAVGAIGESGQKLHDIPGLGDEALWTPVPGGVYLRKGRYSVQVNMPASEDAQIKIARKILGE